MSIWNKDDRFLARWLNNSLDPQEQKQFEESDEFQEFEKIRGAVEDMQAPAFATRSSFEALQKRIQAEKKTKVRTLRRFQVSAIAASILLLIAVIVLWPGDDPQNQNTVAIETQFGQKQTVRLPDGSEVILNAQSSIEYDSQKWPTDRSLQLKGEAFFKVKEGSRFMVATSQGNIEVLGTSFNVKARDQIFEVICYTGKVAVIRTEAVQQLVQGERVRIEHPNTTSQSDWNPSEENSRPEINEPKWVEKGYSEFDNVPLAEVFEELSVQFNLKITGISPRIDTIRYTVDVLHDDPETTIKAIMDPLAIEYDYNKETKELKILGENN